LIKGIDHIGIAVKSIEKALKLYIDAFGLELKDVEIVEEQRVKTAIIPVGDAKIELLESIDPQGVITRYIEKNGEGLHHLAFKVGNIDQTIDELMQKEIPMIDKRPRKGVEGSKIAFLHPKTSGVLIEIVEPAD